MTDYQPNAMRTKIAFGLRVTGALWAGAWVLSSCVSGCASMAEIYHRDGKPSTDLLGREVGPRSNLVQYLTQDRMGLGSRSGPHWAWEIIERGALLVGFLGGYAFFAAASKIEKYESQ